jgi:hypothetical protein
VVVESQRALRELHHSFNANRRWLPLRVLWYRFRKLNRVASLSVLTEITGHLKLRNLLTEYNFEES